MQTSLRVDDAAGQQKPKFVTVLRRKMRDLPNVVEKQWTKR
jgi:hypothetical protein